MKKMDLFLSALQTYFNETGRRPTPEFGEWDAWLKTQGTSLAEECDKLGLPGSQELTIKNERATIEASLEKLRPFFPGQPDVEILSIVLQNGTGECSPATVKAYAKRRKHFTTADVMQYFQVSKYKVAGALAALRGQKIIEPDDPKKVKDGYSRWVYVG